MNITELKVTYKHSGSEYHGLYDSTHHLSVLKAVRESDKGKLIMCHADDDWEVLDTIY